MKIMFTDYFVAVHLAAVGIFENRKYKSYEKYLSISMLSVDIMIIVNFIIAYPQAEMFVHQCSIITTMLAAVVFMLHRCIAISRKNQLRRIIETLRSDPLYFGENRVQSNTIAQLSANFYPAFKIVLCILVIAGSVPYIHILLANNDNIDFNNPAFYVMPYLYHYGDVNSFREFVLLQLLQGMTIAHCAFIYFSFIGLMNYIICNIKAHITEVNEQIDHLIEDFVVRPRLDLSKYFLRKCENSVPVKQVKINDQQLVDKFKNIIKYQLFIQRYIRDFVNYSESILSLYVLQFIFLTIGFTILGTKLLDDNAVAMLQNLSPLTASLYGFYTWCHVSETFGQANELLLRSLYDTQWYRFPVKIRKLMVITMIHTQRAKKIRAFGITDIDFGLGLQLLRAIYSWVNFLALKN